MSVLLTRVTVKEAAETLGVDISAPVMMDTFFKWMEKAALLFLPVSS